MFTWSELAKEFELELLILGKSVRQIQSNRSYVKNFVDYLALNGIEEVQDLPKALLKGYMVNIISSNKYTPKTTNRFVAMVRILLRYAYTEEYITVDNSKAIKYIKEPNVIVNTFTNKEALQLLDYYKLQGKDWYNTRNWAIMYMLFETGIRNQELCNLKLIHLKDNYIEVIEGKGNKSRAVPYTPELKRVMMKYLRVRANYMETNKQDSIEYVFQSYRGNQLTIEAVERVTRNAGKGIKLRSDVKANPHNMRHFFACGLLKNGLDVYSVSKLMGHYRLETTQIYLNSLNQQEIISMSMKNSVIKNLTKKD